MTRFAHAFDLPLTPEAAMPLFTPRGEEAWVPGWAPRYVDPPGGETRVGMIFATGEGAVWWTCLHWDPAGEARYIRLMPGHRAARVRVRCTPAPGGCRVAVAYDWFGLDAAGKAAVAAITDAGFAAEIDGWRALILAHLAA